MKKAPIFLIAGAILVSCLIGSFFWFNKKKELKTYATYNSEFDPYISAFTSGQIGRKSPIVVRFSEDQIPKSSLGKADISLMNFEPTINGKLEWMDTRTLAFYPEEALPSGQVYKADLDFKQLQEKLPKNLQSFRFQFMTMPQDYKVDLTKNRLYSVGDKQFQQVHGEVKTVDFESNDYIEKVFAAKIEHKDVKVNWKHEEEKNLHTFTIDSLPRKNKPYSFKLNWLKNGQNKKEEKEILVPAKSIFRPLHTYAYTEPEPLVVLEFTSELNPAQDLTGLISIPGTKLKFSIEENRVKVYPKKRLSGSTTIKVEPGIQNTNGESLGNPFQDQISFSKTKPSVRLIGGKGVIMPKGQTLPFIFEAIGLNAVDVRIIKVYESNIPQFFQANKISQSRELKRVGQVVAQKKIDLTGQKDFDLNQWHRHSLDLSKLINNEPGAIYEVAIGFRRSYTTYDCGSGADEDVNMLDVGENWRVFTESYEQSYWDYYYYNYSDRNNPCKTAYYRYLKAVKRNVLASDLGLIAKRGAKDLQFITTNLHSAQPEEGVELEVYDYQQQLMATLKTDAKGMAVMPEYEVSPFLLVAKKGSQRGYLRMDDGSSLSMSRFDTKGSTYYKGVKGYLYGERGVWRPGDPMYLSFMLEDKDKVLPNNHPVTFELVNPKGKVVDKIVNNEGLNGFYAFETSTSDDAVTGNYTGRVKVGGANFTKTLKVETIMPNRLKIELDFGTERLNPGSFGKKGSLKSRWLHGAIAKNLKADVKVNMTPGKTTFAKYGGFNFDDFAGTFGSESKTLFEGRLDEAGLAQIPTNIKVNKTAPGRLNANFKVKVFEPGGAFSVDRFSIPYDPYQTYVGIKAPKGDARRNMLLTDKDHNFEIVTVNPDGQAVNTDLDVRVYQMKWKWWWDQSRDRISIYNGKVNLKELKSASVTTVNGNGSYKLNIAYPSWGRYLVRVKDKKGGHATSTIVYVDWPGWAGRSTDNQRDGAKMLSFTSEKQKYNVGEDITLNIPSSSTARMLVSIESGSKVLESYWVNGEEGTTRFTFKATKAMAPNVYANITMLQPHQQTKNDLPIRMYGVIPLKVENPETHLSPKISMPGEIRPNSEFSVRVSEATGKPMTYTVAVVDEGLLGLTRFKTPDPWNNFYQREALDVKTWDMFDDVLGAYGGELTNLLSIGGGSDGGRQDGNKQDRFRPVVKFIGPFQLEAGKTATHKLKMPNYVGEVRTMVVAGDPKGVYGSAEKATPVRQPLMVLGTLPRVLGPGERVRLPVTVFSMKENIRNVQVKIDGGSKVLISGKTTQTLNFNGMGEQTTAFEADVLKSIGTSHVKFTVSAGRESAVYETDIEIRNPNPRITDVFASTVNSKESWKQEYRPLGMAGTNNGSFEVSYMPPLNLGQRLKYLIRYPYGCIEQTTSSVFPQLMLSSLTDLDDGQKSQIDENIKAGIKRLRHFQLQNGGLAYWPGNGGVSEWGTNYAGHFLVLAKKAGYDLPNNMLENIISFQKGYARGYSFPQNDRSWRKRSSANTQAYRLFLLSLAGSPEMAAMNRLRKERDLPVTANWYLAGAYHLAGQRDIARKLAKSLSTDVPEYTELSYTYGSSVRDKAIILQIMSMMDERDRASGVAKYLSDVLCTKRWLSTQGTAYTLVAMAEYGGKGASKRKAKFQYRLNKKDDWKTVTMNSPIWQMDIASVNTGELEFKNQSGGPLYPRLVLDGIPLEGDKTNAENGLKVDLKYMTLNGKEINPFKIEQGTDFMAKVSLRNTGNKDYKEMVLNQVFPSGWEIHNNRLDGNGPKGDKADYIDIRDDRVYTFYSLPKGKSKTFYVMLNASYLGKYWHPSLTSEAMYDNTIGGRVGGAWVEIVQVGEGE
ncbi:MAG: MG2 domain-containing protein [Bacteroidia bacterium]|nr:MG2 domain-containing protein [Bacteroidia bacterium]